MRKKEEDTEPWTKEGLRKHTRYVSRDDIARASHQWVSYYELKWKLPKTIMMVAIKLGAMCERNAKRKETTVKNGE